MGPILVCWAPKCLLWDLPLLDNRYCHKLSSYVISTKTYNPNSRKCQKTHFGTDLGRLGQNSGHQNLFFKSLALSVTRYHGQLSSSTISEKTNALILRKFSDWEMHRWIDRQINKRDFIGCCPTNVQCPITNKTFFEKEAYSSLR